jgi:ribosomal protein S18 acetylase RimI-like enzyme
VEAARPAVADDLPALASLARAAIAELAVTKGGDVWSRKEARQEPIETALAQAIEADDQLVLVGLVEAAPVGYAVVRTDTMAGGDVLGVIDDLYVEPDARDVGVGEVMMDAVLEWCTAKGCAGVDALALPGNRATKNFFERFGLVARAIVVHRRLRDG